MDEDQPKNKTTDSSDPFAPKKPKNGFVDFLLKIGLVLLIGVALIGGTCAILLSNT
jgi:hypothetical protein